MIAINIEDGLYLVAKQTAQGADRSADDQIALWAKLGKAALENPDLPIDFIWEILVSQGQDAALAEPFEPVDRHG